MRRALRLASGSAALCILVPLLSARTATILTLPTPALLSVTTVRTGLLAASSSVLALGITATMATQRTGDAPASILVPFRTVGLDMSELVTAPFITIMEQSAVASMEAHLSVEERVSTAVADSMVVDTGNPSTL